MLIFLLIPFLVSAHQCKWKCDDYFFPALCDEQCRQIPNCHFEFSDEISYAEHICETPKCEIRCEELELSSCTIKCDKPYCYVKCNEKCEVICSRPICHTECVPPIPKCINICESPNCSWKCTKRPNYKIICADSNCKCEKPTVYPDPNCKLIISDK